MNIKKINCGIIKNNNYVLTKGNNCIIVDLSDFKSISDYIENKNLNVVAILLTHTHWDHLLGVEEFVEKYKAPVYISSNRPNYIFDDDFSYTIKKYDIQTNFSLKKIKLEYLKEGEHQIGDFRFSVIDVPGHTACSIIFYFKSNRIMFTGDFLFKNAIGITGLKFSNKKKMQESIEKIKQYENTTTILPGHGDNTNLGDEKQNNIYLNK